MSEETTTEQLAEIEEQAESTPATGYTPPEGWRVLAVGEALREGDVTVRKDGYCYPTERVGGWVGANQRYIRPIEPEPEPVQVREGRWRTRNGLVKDVTAMPTNHEDFAAAYPWWDGVSTWRDDGRWLAGGSTMDLLEYLGPIEPDKTQELPTKTQELETKTQELPEYTPLDGWRVVRFGEQLLPGDVWVSQDGTEWPDIPHWDAAAVSGGRYIRRIKPEPRPESHTAAIEELRSEVSYVQNLLGTERRRVAELEELASSLRAINEAQEKAFEAAGKDNTALRNQLAAVKAELASVAAGRQQLQVELDAAQQVPADSPELRQLRADLAEVTQDRDTYRHAHELLLNDVNATHQRTKAMTVEAIAEWLQPIRAVDNEHLANETLQHLPQIMRSLVGLDSPEDVD